LSQAAEEHLVATRAAILRGVGRCASFLEHALLVLFDNWMRRQTTRLDRSLSQPRKN
jgi:hypothetical protein